jgi:cytidylate kinase
VLADQRRRDHDDENRAIAPLKPAADAVRVDSSGLSAEAVVQSICEIVEQVRLATPTP